MIGAGDLVEIVKWPCCGKFRGHRFIVHDIFTLVEAFGGHGDNVMGLYWLRCDCPRATLLPLGELILSSAMPGTLPRWAPMSWCRKIPPAALDRLVEEQDGLLSIINQKEHDHV